MGKAEKFKPTQPAANSSFVEPAPLARQDELPGFLCRVSLGCHAGRGLCLAGGRGKGAETVVDMTEGAGIV